MAITKVIGETVYVDVPMVNNGTLPGTAYVRVNLVIPGGTGYLNLINTISGTVEGAITLNPGESGTLTFSGVIPYGTPVGSYATESAANSGPDYTGENLDSRVEADQVLITGEFDVQIQEMIEY